MTTTQMIVRNDALLTLKRAHEMAREVAARTSHEPTLMDVFRDPAADYKGCRHNRIEEAIEDYIRDLDAAIGALQARMLGWSPQEVTEKVA